jgi:hypothetical protein
MASGRFDRARRSAIAFPRLCDLLDEEPPTTADPQGEWYAFEKGATKTTGGEGWAYVWRRGCFGWEYKSKGKDLKAASAQLQCYAPERENPPLLMAWFLARVAESGRSAEARHLKLLWENLEEFRTTS